MSNEIAILGLGKIGASLGLAIAEAGVQTPRVGFDSSRDTARSAHRAGAVDRVASSLRSAAKNADLVVLGVPISEVRSTLETIAPSLKPGAVILDTSPIKTAGAGWAKQLLAEGGGYLGFIPVEGPHVLADPAESPSDPRADLFQKGLFALAVEPDTPEGAVNLALSLAQAVGASPFFIEPGEADAIQAAIDTLPSVLSLALMRIAAESPSWRDIQRLAGTSFTNSTSLCAKQSAKDLGMALYLSRDHVLARLGAVIQVLSELHTMIEKEDHEAIIKLCQEVAEAHDDWTTARQRGDLAEPAEVTPEIPKGGIFGRMFGFDPERFKRSRQSER